MKKKKLLPALHIACGEDRFREDLQHIHFINGFAYASDAIILIKWPIKKIARESEMAILEGKRIHKDIWAMIQKGLFVEFTEDCIRFHNGKFLVNINYSACGNIEFEKVFSEVKEKKAEPKEVVGINVNYLKRLIDTMGMGSDVYISFTEQNKASIVKHREDFDIVGLIMPVMVIDEESELLRTI
jgi:hypothetical protein